MAARLFADAAGNAQQRLSCPFTAQGRFNPGGEEQRRKIVQLEMPNLSSEMKNSGKGWSLASASAARVVCRLSASISSASARASAASDVVSVATTLSGLAGDVATAAAGWVAASRHADQRRCR